MLYAQARPLRPRRPANFSDLALCLAADQFCASTRFCGRRLRTSALLKLSRKNRPRGSPDCSQSAQLGFEAGPSVATGIARLPGPEPAERQPQRFIKAGLVDEKNQRVDA